MTGAKAIPALAFVSLLVPVLAAAQQANPAPRPTYDGSDSPDAPLQIHVLDDCRIVPVPDQFAPPKKQRPFQDSHICHLESINSSAHTEEHILGTRLYRDNVRISEHEFVLQNIAPDPVVFVVQQQLPKDWSIDSDPQPSKVVGDTAFFPVHAAPGQIVRLHVGMRRTIPMKPETISQKSPLSTLPSAQSASTEPR
ncbi:MAG TPA: hypothetical protein VK716_05280 [Terracidiphilus sp.]|jgi:hypothetical protein|nr:hypothetical protein [Terracidiphilus sp.]